MNEAQLRFYSFRLKGLVKSVTLLTFISIDICHEIPLQRLLGVIGTKGRKAHGGGGGGQWQDLQEDG